MKSKKEIYKKDYKTDFEFLEDVLKINGVNPEDILCENNSTNTKENAFFSRKVLDRLGMNIESAIICCKNFHARRCLMCYQFAFPETKFYIYPVRYSEGGIEINSENWFESKEGTTRVLVELQRCGSQFIQEFLSLNKKL